MDVTAVPAAPDVEAALAALAPRLSPGASLAAGVRRLSGGASQETWMFDVEGGAAPGRFILRRAPGAAWKSDLTIELETEAELMRRAGGAGVPSPQVRHVLAPEDGLGKGFIMGFVAGETLGQKILKDPALDAVRPDLARQCGATLAAIHRIDVTGIAGLNHSTPRQQLDGLAASHQAGGWVRPVFDLALRWLADRCPEGAGDGLVHGDFRNGNLIIGPDGIRAVLDWELAHRGDPMEDLGWICVNSWRFGAIDRPVGGFGTREDLFAAYEAAGGIRVDPARVRFWQALGTLRWGIICADSANRFLAGTDPAVERAVIGRRTSETELDLIDLMTGRD